MSLAMVIFLWPDDERRRDAFFGDARRDAREVLVARRDTAFFFGEARREVLVARRDEREVFLGGTVSVLIIENKIGK